MMLRISSAGLMETMEMMQMEMTVRAFRMTISLSIQTVMMMLQTENNHETNHIMPTGFPVGYFFALCVELIIFA